MIRDAVSHKLYIPPVNPLIFLRESTQAKNPTTTFQIGYYLRYTNEGHNEMVDLLDINTNDTNSTKYIIKLLCVNTEVITKDFLK